MESRGSGAPGATPFFRDGRAIGFNTFALDRALIRDFSGSDWLFTALANELASFSALHLLELRCHETSVVLFGSEVISPPKGLNPLSNRIHTRQFKNLYPKHRNPSDLPLAEDSEHGL